MGMMNKIRENTGVVLWILVFAFGVIWVLQDSGGLDVIGNLGTNIGSVNGDPITYEEYSLAIDSQTKNYQTQTGNTMPVQMLDQTRDRVFQQLVDDKLRLQEMSRLGMEVADAEIVDMIQGEKPHPIITYNFGDGDGNVDRALLQNFIENPDSRDQWIQIEDYLRGERRRTKLDGLIAATIRVSASDIDFRYQQQNRKIDVRYVSSRFTSVPDDSISYDDGDLRRFYNQHKNEFKRKRTYTLSYTTVSKSPTAEDSAAVFSDIEGLRDTFIATKEDSLFLLRNGSERPYTDAYFRPDELDEVISKAVFDDSAVGNVVGPVVSNDLVHLIKILDVRKPEEPVVEARHILFKVTEGDASSDKKALKEAREILAKLRAGEDFALLARLHSGDPGSAQRGGSLGWFGKGKMVPEFEKAAFGAKIGRVVGPIKSSFGYHLIEVTDRAKVEAQIADFGLSLRASINTLNKIQEDLDDLQYFADESGDFEGEAGRRSYELMSVQIEDKQTFIPGIGTSRPLMNFLETASAGDLSPVIELDDQFLSGSVIDIQLEGIRPFDEVRDEIEPRLRNELKSTFLANKMKSALENGFDGLAAAMGTTEKTSTNLSFSNMIVQGIGRDPLFVGNAMGLTEGAISKVVIGLNSVYVIQLDHIAEPEPATDEQREQIYSQLLGRRQSLIRNQWISALRDKADIVDNRRKFLQ